MDCITDPNCPLCWDNGKLQGGKLLSETDQLYAYAFFTEDGNFSHALITVKHHHDDMRTLEAFWGAEFGGLYDLVLALMPDAQPLNGYWNKGFVAGQRVMGHWHVRIEPMTDGRPSSEKGLALLRKEYDQLHEDHEALLRQHQELQQQYDALTSV